MDLWSIITGILGAIGLVYAGLHVYFKNKKDAKLESFRSIMEESKKFREEFKEELRQAKSEIADLRQQIKDSEVIINELSGKLKESLLPRSWLYYYLQKPIKQIELETIIRRYIETPTDCVLVIEDDPYTQKVLSTLAANHNWNVVRATSGKNALEMIKINPPKLIIIDMVMPVADSFDVLNIIHENRELSNIPLIVISSINLKEVDRIYLHTKINESVTKA